MRVRTPLGVPTTSELPKGSLRSNAKAYKQAKAFVFSVLPEAVSTPNNSGWVSIYANPNCATRLTHDVNVNEAWLRAAYMLGWKGEI